MFLGTLGLDEWCARNWAVEAHQRNSTSPQNKKKPSRADESKKESVRSFLESLPKLPSHYCRSSTTQLYLEPLFRSYNHLYSVYKSRAIENQEKPAKKPYSETFEEI